MVESAVLPPTGVTQLIARLPPFSPVALRLMSVVSDKDVSFKEIAKLIHLDPALSGEVLKLANSGFYGRRGAVRSILHAIAMVGMDRLTTMVITAALWKALPANPSPFVKGWWRHSLASALVAERVGSKMLKMDYAYTAGLLHGIGQLALFQYSHEYYAKVIDLASATGDDLTDHERRTFGADHAEVAESILGQWNLPPSVRDAVAHHHELRPAASPLAHAVYIGCCAAEYVGFGKCGCERYIEAGEIPGGVTALIEGKYLPEGLAQEVNAIECSLM